MSSQKRLAATLCVVTLIAWSALLPCPSRADDETAVIGDVLIEEASATPAKAGETTRISLTIENTGTETVRITGLRLAVPGPSKVIGFLGTSHSARIDGFPVEPDEVSRLDSRTAWIEVGPLSSDLVPGSVVTGRLMLGDFEAPLRIHVSPETKLPTRTRSISAAWPGWSRC